jgi:hypothetical protein
MASDEGAVTRQDQQTYRIAIRQVDVEAYVFSLTPYVLPSTHALGSAQISQGASHAALDHPASALLDCADWTRRLTTSVPA